MDKQPTLLLDGKYYLYRSLKANVRLTHNDIITTVYYNYLNSLKSIAKKFKPNNIVIMWDSEHSKRREYFSGYKVKDNTKQDEIIKEQIEYIESEYDNIKLILKRLGFVSYNRYGLEADDLFFYYIEEYPKEDIIVVSRDADLYQLLVFPNVRIYNPHEKQFITRKYISDKYDGITPEQWFLYKAIGGCKSDAVPGIPTIGEKSTIQYIKGIASPTIVKKIKDNWDIVARNKKLVKLPLLPIDKIIPLKQRITKLNLEELKNICFAMGFKSFLEDLNDWKVFKIGE
jgi:DNA polymerase-1